MFSYGGKKKKKRNTLTYTKFVLQNLKFNEKSYHTKSSTYVDLRCNINSAQTLLAKKVNILIS